MWIIKSKDCEGKERKIIASGATARTICEVLDYHGLPVMAYRVNTYRDSETMKLFCLDENGHRFWVKSERDLLEKGYSELLCEIEFKEMMKGEGERNSKEVV